MIHVARVKPGDLPFAISTNPGLHPGYTIISESPLTNLMRGAIQFLAEIRVRNRNQAA